jgi:hypothetical protein
MLTGHLRGSAHAPILATVHPASGNTSVTRVLARAASASEVEPVRARRPSLPEQLVEKRPRRALRFQTKLIAEQGTQPLVALADRGA